MKYFLSQKMNNLSEEEIINNTSEYVKLIKKIDPKLEYVDVFITEKSPTNIKDDKINVWYLGSSLQKLAECDILIVVDRCNESNRGCIIEYETAKRYGYKIMYLDTTFKTLIKEEEIKELY